MSFEKNYLKLYTNDHFIPILASVMTTDDSTFPVRSSHGSGDETIVINDSSHEDIHRFIQTLASVMPTDDCTFHVRSSHGPVDETIVINDSSRDDILLEIDGVYQSVVKGFNDVTPRDMRCVIAFLATAKTDDIITHQILATALYWMSACATGSVDPECYEHAGHVVAIVYRMMSHMQHFFGLKRDTSDDSLYSKVWSVIRAVLEKYELMAAYVAATYGDGIFDADGNQIEYDAILGDLCVFASDADRAWSLAGHWKLARNRMPHDTTGFSSELPAWAIFRNPDVLSHHCYTRLELAHDPLCLVLAYPSVFGYHKVWAAAVDADECDHTAAYSHVTVVSVYDAAYDALDFVMHVSREGMVTAADHALKTCATALPDEYHTPHDLFVFYDRPTGDWPKGCGHTVREYAPDRVWKAFRKLSRAVYALANDSGPYRCTSPVDELVDAAAECGSDVTVDELSDVYVSVMSMYVAETGMAEWVGRYLDATTDRERVDALTTIEDLILDFASSLDYLCNILVRIGIGNCVMLHSLPGHGDHYENGPASDMANRVLEISRLASYFTDSTLAVDNDVRRRMASAVMTGTAQAPFNIATD